MWGNLVGVLFLNVIVFILVGVEELPYQCQTNSVLKLLKLIKTKFCGEFWGQSIAISPVYIKGIQCSNS